MKAIKETNPDTPVKPSICKENTVLSMTCYLTLDVAGVKPVWSLGKTVQESLKNKMILLCYS